MRNLVRFAILIAAGHAVGAGAQTSSNDKAPTALTASARAAQYAQSAPPPHAMNQPPRNAASGPILLRYQTMMKLKQRFENADLDHSGSLTREEARKAGLGFIDRNFDHIDTAQRGVVSFDDLNSYLIERREEARSR